MQLVREEHSLRENQADLINLKTSKTKLENELKTLKTEVENERKVKEANLQKTRREYEFELKINDDLEQERRALAKELEEVNKTADKLTIRLQDANGLKERALKNKEIKEDELTELRTATERSKKTLEGKRSENDAVKVEVEKLEKLRSEKLKELKTKEIEYNEKKRIKDQQLKLLRDQKDDLTSVVGKLDNDYKRKKRQLDADAVELKNKRSDLDRDIRLLEEMFKSPDEQKDLLLKEQAELEAKNKILYDEKDKITQAKSELEGRNANLAQLRLDLEKKQLEYQEFLGQQLDEELNQLKDKITEAEKQHLEDKKETEILLRDERLKNVDMNARLSVMTLERDENKKLLEKLSEQLIATTNEQVDVDSKLARERELLERQMEEFKKEDEKREQQMAEEKQRRLEVQKK